MRRAAVGDPVMNHGGNARAPPRHRAAVRRAQAGRIADAGVTERRLAARPAPPSLVETAPDGASECRRGRVAGEIAGRDLRLDLDPRIGRNHLVGQGNALVDADALAHSASHFMSLMEAKRWMRVIPSQCSTSGISSWNRMSWTPATHSVRLK